MPKPVQQVADLYAPAGVLLTSEDKLIVCDGSFILDVINERCWHGKQAWNYELIVRSDDTRLRVSIVVAREIDKSPACVAIWRGKSWSRVASLSPTECASYHTVNYVSRQVSADRFHADAKELFKTALAIIR